MQIDRRGNSPSGWTRHRTAPTRGTAAVVVGFLLLSLWAAPANAQENPAGDRFTADWETLEKLVRDADRSGISLEQALDDYVDALVARGEGGAHVGNPMGADPQELPFRPPDIVIDGIPLAELDDIQLVAQDEGLDYAEAIDRYGWQSDFGEVAELLQLSYPDEFAGAAFQGDNDKAWIAFRGRVPARASQAIQRLPVGVGLIGNRGFSEAELFAEQDVILDRVEERSDIDAFYSELDLRGGVIKLEVAPDDSTPAASGVAALEAEYEAALEARYQPANPSITVDVQVVDEIDALLEPDKIRGGGHLKHPTEGNVG